MAVGGDSHVGMADYLNQPSPLVQQLAESLLPGFLRRYVGRIAPEHVAVSQRFVPVIDAWAADRVAPPGLVHGDFRLDNLLFTETGCNVIDWQTLSWGPALFDLSYFLGGAWTCGGVVPTSASWCDCSMTSCWPTRCTACPGSGAGGSIAGRPSVGF